MTRTATLSALLLAAASCTATDPTRTTSDETRPAGGTVSQGSNHGKVPKALDTRLDELDGCQSRLQETHGTYPVQEIQDEAASRAVLYAYYNLDSDEIDNALTHHVAGVNDQCSLFANDAIGAVRAVLEPKPGAPVDPANPESLIDIFTDVCGLRVINNESGWYEGWLFHDVVVPRVAAPRPDGHAAFGTITAADAAAIAALGDHHDVPGAVFTSDGKAPAGYENLVPVVVSLGAWNALQGEDGHAYWELNEYTNWTFPLYEMCATGGLPGTFDAGLQYAPLGGGPDVDSRVPGSGPSGVVNYLSVAGKVMFGDDPENPRDADRANDVCGEDSPESEQRLRFTPSGLAQEVLLDAYVRKASFEPGEADLGTRLVHAYAAEIARIDENHDGIVQFSEADIEDESDGQPNLRLFLAPNAWNRIIVTKELDDGLLAPRFHPEDDAWLLEGDGVFLPIAAEED